MRLIDADALMADIRETIEASGCVNHESEIIDCIEYADTIATAKRGRWEKVKTDALVSWQCTECRIGFLDDAGLDKLHYCPNCGCKMMEEGTHD